MKASKFPHKEICEIDWGDAAPTMNKSLFRMGNHQTSGLVAEKAKKPKTGHGLMAQYGAMKIGTIMMPRVLNRMMVKMRAYHFLILLMVLGTTMIVKRERICVLSVSMSSKK